MRLFKYVRPERIDILENQQIAFTPPAEFNDVLDTRPRVIPMTSKSVLKRKAKVEEAEVLKQMPPSFQRLPRKEHKTIGRELFKGSIKEIQKTAASIAKKLQEDIYTGISEHFGILCVTTNPDSKAMWQNFADGHKGFVIEFDAKKPRFASENLHQVVYSNEVPTYDPAVGSQGWWKVKSKDLEHEQEYRIVAALRNCKQKIIGEQTIYLLPLPRDCIKAVYAGLKMGAALKSRLKDICKASNIALFEAVYVNSEAGYEFRKVITN